MSTTRKSRPKRTRTIRKTLSTRRKQKRKISDGGISGGSGIPILHTSPGGLIGTHFLNPKIKDVSPLDINAEDYFKPIDNDWNNDFQPLGLMVEWVPALYKTLKRVPDFNDDQDWENIPDIHVLAKYLMKQAQAAKPKNYSMFFGKNTRGDYTLAYAQEQSRYSNMYTLCIEWIEIYERYNASLAQLTIEMIGLVSLACHLDLIFTENHDILLYDTGSFHTCEDEDYDLEVATQVQSYKEGAIRGFYNRIKKSRQTSLTSWMRRVKQAKATNELDIKVKCWLESGVEVLRNPARIGEYMPPFYYFQEEVEIMPLTVNDLFGIHWSFRDHVYGQVEDMINATEREAGVIGPVIAFEYTEKAANDKFGIKQIELLVSWANIGRDIYYKHFDKRFEAIYAGKEDKSLLINQLA